MGRPFHFNLDEKDESKSLLENGFEGDSTADSPRFARSDVIPSDFVFFRKDKNGNLVNVDPPTTLKVSAGELDAAPTGGTFTISDDSSTTAAIAYNASAATVQAAVRAALTTDLGAAIVTGPDGGPWLITAGVGGSLPYDITVNATGLSPSNSTAQVITTEEGDVSHAAQWQVRLQRAYPMLRTSGWAALPSASVSATIIQAGSATANKIYEVSWNSDAYAGTVSLSVLADAVTRTVGPFPFNATAEEIKQAFEDHPNIEVDEVSVQQTDICTYVIAFVGGSLAASNSPTISTESNTLSVPVGLSGTLSVATAPADEILDGAEEAEVFFEVEVQYDTAQPRTIYRADDAVFFADLISNNPGQSTGDESFPTLMESLWMNNEITGYTGGSTTSLDFISTVDRSAGQYIGFTHATDGIRIYLLLNSTDAESSPTTIRPDDFHAVTNAKVWRLQGQDTSNLTSGTLGLTRGGTGATTAFSAFQSIRPYITLDISEEFTGYFIDENTVANGWRSFDSAGTGSVANGTASGSAWGLVTVTTGATSGNGRHLGLGTVSSNGAFDDLNSIAPWEAWFRFSISATTSILTFVGFLSNPFGAETTCDKIALRFDTGSDSTFKVTCRSGGSETVTDTTVTPSASTFYSLRIWSESAGTIKFRVYSATGVAQGNEVTISTNVPSSVMSPDFYVHTLTSAARTLTADTFRMQATLSR